MLDSEQNTIISISDSLKFLVNEFESILSQRMNVKGRQVQKRNDAD